MKEEEKKISDADRERRYQISEDFVLRQIGGEYAIIPSCRRRFCSAFYASKGEKWIKNETHGKMWKIQGIPYIGLHFTSIASRIYRHIGTSLILV